MSRAPRKAQPPPPAPRRLFGPAAICLACGLLLIGFAAAPRLRQAAKTTPASAPELVTIPVHLTVEQFARAPTWAEVIAYYGLDSKLVEPTRMANAAANGQCPPEPIALPHDVVIALTAGSGKVCSPRPRLVE